LKGIFARYAFDSLAWLVYNPATRHVIRSTNAVFDETWRDSLTSSPGPPIPEDDDYDDDYEIVSPLEPQAPTTESNDVQEGNPDVPTRVMQLELERLDNITDNPRSRSEKAQASRSFALNSEDDSSVEVILLAVTKPSSYRRP